MHILTCANPVLIGPGGQGIREGSYLVEDVDAGNIMANNGGGTCELKPFHGCESLRGDYNGSVDPITIIRPGRFGDLILLTPCLREIKRRWPKAPLRICCLPQYRDAIIGLPYIDGYPPYPLSMENVRDKGTIASLETLVALRDSEKEIHMTDLFAERLGMTDFEDRKPDFILTQNEKDWAHDMYPKGKRKRVAIQVKSSTPSRDYPPARMHEVLKLLVGRNWDVVLLGTPNEISGKKAGMINCAADGLSFRQSAAVLATADVFLGPDSALIHVAGALGVPAVGLFSVVPWKLRTAYCPTTFVMQATKGCDMAPCFHAPRAGTGFPANGPCQKERKCEALDTLAPHDVVVRVERQAGLITA